MEELIKFQTDRGLDKQEFIALNEQINIVEELLELVGYDVPKDNRTALMHEWNRFVSEVASKKIALFVGNNESTVPDALCDIITFATGGLMKDGHSPLLAIEQCGKEINSRVGSMVDGKFEKDLSKSKDWYKADYSNSKVVI